MKPENVLIDFQGHIKLTDFGLCRRNFKKSEKADSLCGSPEYVCPEMLQSGVYTRMLDFYQIGALLYEMLTGLPPNYSRNKKQMFSNIVKNEPNYPSYLSKPVKNLL